MARAWRVEYPKALYHILSRGNERRGIFLNDGDRVCFLETLGDFARRFDIDIFAYVLMENHYHLLLRTNRANLCRSMQWFGTTYTRRFNVNHRRSGNLFQGRYKSHIVENDAYLLRLSCCIHINPLRSGIVKRLADFKWSSYPAYANGRKAPEWLNTDFILSGFANSADKNLSYRKMVRKYSEGEKRLCEDIRHGFIVGSQKFVDHIRYVLLKNDSEFAQTVKMGKDTDPDTVLDRAAKLLNCDLETFRRSPRISKANRNKRDLLIYLLWRTGNYSNKEIGKLFGLTYSSVSRRKSVAEKNLTKEPETMKMFEQIEREWGQIKTCPRNNARRK